MSYVELTPIIGFLAENHPGNWCREAAFACELALERMRRGREILELLNLAH